MNMVCSVDYDFFFSSFEYIVDFIFGRILIENVKNAITLLMLNSLSWATDVAH
jgi:hypothetical protein